MGPRGPAVTAFWLSGTGAPAAVVSFFLFSIELTPHFFALEGRLFRQSPYGSLFSQATLTFAKTAQPDFGFRSNGKFFSGS
jgi:hypothetical protein